MSICMKCGDCCEAIGIDLNADDIRREVQKFYDSDDWSIKIQYLDTSTYKYDILFVHEHWHEISFEEAQQINPRLKQKDIRSKRGWFTCDQFNKETRECMAQYNKPNVCKNFPWYDGPINEYALIVHPRCSYWYDIPLVDWPLTINNDGQLDYDITPIPVNIC